MPTASERSRTRRARARKRRRKQLILRVLLLAAAAAILAGAYRLWAQGKGTGGGGTGAAPAVVNSYTTLDEDWVTVDLLPVNDYSRPGTALPAVNAIVVHYVGNPGTTAEQNRNYFADLAETHETKASSHFVIGIDGTVIQCVPLNEESYCSNQRNGDTVAIECCHPGKDGKFTDATYNSLVRLLRTLCQMYGLTEDDVIRHYDVTGKECPLYYVKHPDAWAALKQDVFSGFSA